MSDVTSTPKSSAMIRRIFGRSAGSPAPCACADVQTTTASRAAAIRIMMFVCIASLFPKNDCTQDNAPLDEVSDNADAYSPQVRNGHATRIERVMGSH